ncbi:MAG: two-component regulator propeller domain-containing protein, partial [Catalinimonas sp.]
MPVFSASAQVDAQARFEHLSIDEGLSQSTVRCVLQDYRGFLWFGTEDGLNRYNAYDFTIYRPQRGDSTTLSHHTVNVLLEDRNRNIWVGTDWGLSRFSYKSSGFQRYLHVPEAPNSLSHNRVTALLEGHDGVLWVGTTDGLNRFDVSGNQITRYQSAKASVTSLTNDYILSLHEDRQHNLWVGTRNGLHRWESRTNTFVSYARDDADAPGLNEVYALTNDGEGNLWVGTGAGLYRFDVADESFEAAGDVTVADRAPDAHRVNCLYRTSEGFVWAGTQNEGLLFYNPANGQVRRFRHRVGDPSSLSSNQVRSLRQDRAGILWIGLQGGGVDKYDPQAQQFITLRAGTRPGAMSNDHVMSVFDEENGPLWVGTSEGLNHYDKSTGRFHAFRHDRSDARSLADNNVWSLLRDRRGTFWVGTDRGFSRFNPADSSFANYNLPVLAPHGSRVRSICEGPDSLLWVATYNGGMYRFDPLTQAFEVYRSSQFDTNTISHNRVYKIVRGAEGTLWIGTYRGLDHFAPDANQFRHPLRSSPDGRALGPVLDICRGREGEIWFASYGTGLCRLDPATGQLRSYDEDDGLPNTGVYAVVEDDEGHVWASHNKGLSRLDKSTGIFHNFDARDGLQSNEYNAGAAAKNHRGEVFFGGIRGLNVFNPGQLRPNTYVPPVVITAFRKFDDEVVFDRDVCEVEKIELDYSENFIAFEFAALNYTSTEKNRYAYKLDNFDEGWVYAADRRYASYTNLDGGTYTFRVKA